MKKSKIVIALLLAAVIVIICANVPTFSWFTRPQTHSGNEFVLGTESNQYNAYNGSGVQIVDTKMSSDDGVTFTESVSNFNGSDLPMYGRNYYCTTIRNTTSTEQNVSLFASTLTSNIVEFALGVNGPTRTYHDYTMLSAGEATKTNGTTKRVYFRRPTDDHVNNVDWHTGNYWLHWWNDSDGGEWIQMTDTGDNNNYFANVPSRAKYLYFYTNNNQTGSDRTQQVTLADWSQTPTDSQVFVAWNNTEGDHSFVKLGNHYHVDGPNFVEWYNTIGIVNGSFFDAGIEYPQATGAITYSSSNSSVFTVDSNGKITTHGIGTATLTTTATGETFGDTVSKTTTVTVSATGTQTYKDVPIVKNIWIHAYNPADTSDNPVHDVKIYWYVVNNTTSGTDLDYTIDNIYLGL